MGECEHGYVPDTCTICEELRALRATIHRLESKLLTAILDRDLNGDKHAQLVALVKAYLEVFSRPLNDVRGMNEAMMEQREIEKQLRAAVGEDGG